MSNFDQLRVRRQLKKDVDNDSSLPTNDDLVDEDDQEKIIQQIHDEYLQQQHDIESIFIAICRVAAMVSLILTIILQYRKSIISNTASSSTIAIHHNNADKLLRWTHAILSIVIHLCTPLITMNLKGKDKYMNMRFSTSSSWYFLFLPMLITLPVASIAVWIARKGNDDESIYYHYSIVVSNIMLIGSALLFHNDEKDFMTSIHDLKSSKYQYKTL
jgi:hypothetical protein